MSSVDRHIGALVTALTSNGLGIRVNSDANSFRDFYCRMAGHEPASPLDATFVRLNDRSFFWLQIFDHHRNPIGCGAGRLVLAPAWRGGLRRVMAKQALFIDRCPPLLSTGTVPQTNLSGRLGYVGGGWIKPTWRRHGLIGIVIQLVHAYMIEHYRTDHNFGFVRPNHIPLALGEDGYAFAEVGEAFQAYCAGTGFDEPLHMVQASRAQLLQRYSLEPAYRLRGDMREVAEIPGENRRIAPLSQEHASVMRKAG